MLPTKPSEEEEGQWQYEGEAIIGASADGKMEAVFKITHLSYYNLASINLNTCSTADPISFSVQSIFTTYDNLEYFLLHASYMK